MIAGTLSRIAAMSMPGTILSQHGTRTSASKAWAMVMDSTVSAMSSRLGSEYSMPRWFMASPSQMPMTPNSMGTPPPGAHAGLDRVDDAAQVEVPGHDLAEGVDDADERALHLGVAHTERAQQRTVRRARQTLLDLVASHGSSLLVAGGPAAPAPDGGHEPEMIPETPRPRRGCAGGRGPATGGTAAIGAGAGRASCS